jgi:hypothetical protein
MNVGVPLTCGGQSQYQGIAEGSDGMRRYARWTAIFLLAWNGIGILSRIEYISRKLLWLWSVVTVALHRHVYIYGGV